MDASAAATVISAGVAAVAAVLSVFYAQKAARANRALAAEELATKFREPILQASFNLQSRLYNIAKKDFLRKFQDGVRGGDKEYTVENTLYLLGQYFCWVEIVRRESQFLDPRSQEKERSVADQMERVRNAFASSDQPVSPILRLFRGQQRAIGEVLLRPARHPQPGWPRWECMGYASFVKQLPSRQLDRWFQPLRIDLEAMRSDPTSGLQRIASIQRELLDLVDLLDPEARRTSGRLRERL